MSPLKTESERIQEELHEIGFHLGRIADALEGLRDSTNPVAVWDIPDDDKTERAFYTNEDEEIVAHKLKEMGREYKPRIQKR